MRSYLFCTKSVAAALLIIFTTIETRKSNEQIWLNFISSLKRFTDRIAYIYNLVDNFVDIYALILLIIFV